MQISSYLGRRTFDNSIWGPNAIHHRHFFHLLCDETTPDKWSYEEKDLSIRIDATPEQIIFDFHWIELPDDVPELQLGHDAFLDSLLLNMDLKNSTTE